MTSFYVVSYLLYNVRLCRVWLAILSEMHITILIAYRRFLNEFLLSNKVGLIEIFSKLQLCARP